MMRDTPSQTTPLSSQELVRAEVLLDQIQLLQNQIQQMRDGLSHSHRLATLGTLASMVAHEYNNILTPIISYAQLALKESDDPLFMRKALQKSLDGAQRAAKISSALLGFAGNEKAHAVSVLSDVIQQSLSCLARAPKRDGIALHVDVPQVDLAISPLALQQVLMNLILNAIKAMKQTGGGSLSITAQPVDNQMQIDITDTGPGIDSTIMDKLFDPFVTFSHDATHIQHNHAAEKIGETGGTGGTGLGLFICKDLIEAALGHIFVSSVPGQGATFHIQLPLAQSVFEST